MRLRAFLLAFCAFPVSPLFAAVPVAPAVIQFSPQGELESVRQVTARFTSDMVRLGDPRVKNPFTIDCVAKGKGRWIDTRNWAYDFDRDVPRGHSCTFTLVRDQRDVTGHVLAGKTAFSFSTSPLAEALPATGGLLKLDFFVPQGETYPVRQVQTRFSEPMVRLGQPRYSNPFTISCPLPGKGRWVDTRNWVYDFAQDLPSGIACEFRLVKDLRGVSGKTVSSYPLYRFNTGGPAVMASRPYDGQEDIDENQTFLLQFDGENDVKSLPLNSYCLVEGIKEKVPLRFYTVEQTRTFVAQLPEEYRQWWNQSGRQKERRAVQCGRQLPPDAKVKLVFAKGLASKTGVQRSADQALTFRVRPAFTASFTCTRESARQACAPMTDMRLEFTDIVSAERLKAIRLEGGGRTWMPVPNAGEGEDYYGEGGTGPDDFVPGTVATFRGPFPAEASFTLKLSPDFRDESGRVLTNAARFPLAVKTAAYPPLAKFAANFGIVEKTAGAVPLTVRNLEAGGVQGQARLLTLKLPDGDVDLLKWLQRFRKHQDDQSCYQCTRRDEQGRRLDPDPRSFSLLAKEPAAKAQALPRTQAAKEFEVLGLPVPQTGVYVHEVESRWLGTSLMETPAPMYVSAMSVVTNLGVHLRSGKENALVWVTALDTAKPVANADVALYECKGRTVVWRGRTDAQGIARISNPPDFSAWGECMSSHAVIVRSGQDRGIVLPGWDEGIQSWRFNLPGWRASGELVAHSILDRTLFRAGETLHARHVVRELALGGLNAPRSPRYSKLVIEHEGSGQQYELPLAIDAGGNGDTTWAIPKAAKLGRYVLRLETKNDSYVLANFRVEEFRLPVLKPRLQLPGGPLVLPPVVPVDMQLSYLNGGGYPNAPVTLRGRVRTAGYNFTDFDDYSFGDYASYDEEGESDAYEEIALEEKTLTLDANGGLRVDSVALPAVSRISQLAIEMEFRDPSGENQTVSATTTLWPAAVLPGIRLPSWITLDGKSPQPVDVVTLGPDGKPRGRVPVTVTAELHVQQTHRRRTVGGFYSYDSVTKKEPLPVSCGHQTDASGRLRCSVMPGVSGNLVLRVTSRDETGREMSASTSTWVSNGERWWFGQDNDDRIDLLPEKKEYQTGETMRFQVRMPFPEATALVSVERDGVIETRVQVLDSKNPVITLPVKAEYAPNVFVSALLVRGRNAEVAPTALVDLGKPAFKLGIANVKVNWSSMRLGVAVAPDRLRYRPREQANVSVQVTPPAGQALPADTEVTIAAVDEALLELAGNDTFDVLTPMMVERGYGMNTSTSQLQVVGKRHYGRKALPPGGGGGRGANTRELFDTLVYWQARAKVDANGRAVFTVPLNDSLTGFRLVASAVSRDRFGHGESRMESFQDLQMISGLPLTVRQGDKLDPGFTLRNATDKAMSVQFVAAVDEMGTLVDKAVSIPAGQSVLVMVPFTVPRNITGLHWTVRAEGKTAGDALKLTQKVLDPVPERVWQATMLQLTAPTDIPVQKPADALSGGGLVVSGQARLADSLDTVREYFRNYPYSCLEQKTSKAAGLQDRARWDELMDLLPTYLDDNGLAGFYPNTSGYPFLTAHILRVSRALNWPIPEASREKMLTGLVNYTEGRIPFEDWRLRELDDAHRRLEVLSILAASGRLKASHLDALKIDPPRWTTSMLVNWFEVLRHGKNIPRQAERLAQAESLLRSRLTLQGSALLLSEGDFNWWWLYDNDAAVVSRLMLATMDLPAWREDQPRLIRGLLMRQREGHWATTVANMWGGFALKRFSDTFEREVVSGTTRAQLGVQSVDLSWAQKEPAPVRLEWPAAPATLKLSQQGSGAPWITVQSRARIPLKAPYGTGFTVSKSVEPLQQKVKGKWSVGDVVRINLTMNAQSDIGWVAVDDPVPSGATLLGRALGRDSNLAAERDGGDWTWATYAEFGADAYRAYYERIYKGEWHASYTLRLNQSGDFVLPPTRVEAMYAPEMFGMTPNAAWVVVP